MKKQLSLAFVGALLMAACSVYHPQMTDLPLIHHKGDGHVEANVSYDILVIHLSAEMNLSGSYGLTDKLAVQGMLSYDFERSGSAQAAIGLYKPIEKFVIEGYLGAGGGVINTEYTDTDNDDTKRTCEGHYLSAFVQGNAGWVGLLNGHLDLGAGVKCGFFNPDITIGALIDNGTPDHYGDSHFLLEPQLMLRMGGEHLKVTLRAGFCTLEPFNSSDATPPYAPTSFAAGLNYRF